MWPKIRKNNQLLVQLLDTERLLDHFYAEVPDDVFGTEEYELVRSQPTPQGKAREFLRLLGKKPEECQRQFVTCLKKTQSFLADEIEKITTSTTNISATGRLGLMFFVT